MLILVNHEWLTNINVFLDAFWNISKGALSELLWATCFLTKRLKLLIHLHLYIFFSFSPYFLESLLVNTFFEENFSLHFRKKEKRISFCFWISKQFKICFFFTWIESMSYWKLLCFLEIFCKTAYNVTYQYVLYPLIYLFIYPSIYLSVYVYMYVPVNCQCM